MSIVEDDSLVFNEGERGVRGTEGFEGPRDESIDCGFGEVVFG